MGNSKLQAAWRKGNDEFYTSEEDVAQELAHYSQHFRDKVVYCNCDDPYRSAFVAYFVRHFKELGLRRLIATCYRAPQQGLFDRAVADVTEPLKFEYMGVGGLPQQGGADARVSKLCGDGDFRSQECVDILQEADIVVTNPPFSLLNEHIGQSALHGKKFLVIGHQNSLTDKALFPLIKGNKVWLGRGFRGNVAYFLAPHYDDRSYGGGRRAGRFGFLGCYGTQT
jgi:hypothetical protein